MTNLKFWLFNYDFLRTGENGARRTDETKLDLFFEAHQLNVHRRSGITNPINYLRHESEHNFDSNGVTDNHSN